MNLLDLNEIKYDLDALPQAQNKVKFNSAELNDICINFKDISKSICIQIEEQTVSFSAKGNHEFVKVTNTFNEAEQDINSHIYSIETNETVQKEFTLRYVKLISKCYNLSDIVSLELSCEGPILFIYDIFDIGKLKFYLAPLFEENDEVI